ncbi:uncharacterized protein [Diabrotica undecimpunctata]|uniref:uncharacterized protein n=1 Tax=Diabrotica undecimpunctata TaxID=50387 RepID=UPI003B634A44
MDGWFLVIDKICDGLSSHNMNLNAFQILENITLADTEFYKTNKIDLLLEAIVFWELLCIWQFKLNKKGPFIQETKLGWIVSGPIPGSNAHNEKRICNFAENKNIKSQLQRFWSLNECRRATPYTAEELKCEERKLEKYAELKQQYHDFMLEYIQLGYMSKVEDKDQVLEAAYYLCHHKVIKNSSITMKCRVVFDGSTVRDSGISINNTLMTGPRL